MRCWRIGWKYIISWWSCRLLCHMPSWVHIKMVQWCLWMWYGCKAILECWDGARAVWWLKMMAKTIIGVKAHFLRMLVPNSPLKYLSGPQRMYFQVPKYTLHIAISPVKAVLTYKVPWTEPVLLVFDLNMTAIARHVNYSEHTAHWSGTPIQMSSFEALIKVQPCCQQFPAIPSHTLPHLKAP